MIDFNGTSPMINFKQPSYTTDISRTCSLQWHNRMLLFGGSSKTSADVHEVKNCQIETIQKLSFSHYSGMCGVDANEHIYLCFNYYDGDVCRRANAPNAVFKLIQKSLHDHALGSTAMNRNFSDDHMIVLGSRSSTITELYSIEKNNWRQLANYPFG